MAQDTGKQREYFHMADGFIASQKLFQALIENTSDVIALVSAEGCFTYISPSVQTLLGYTPEELLGQSMSHLSPPGQLANIVEQISLAAKTPGLIVKVEHVLLHKDGSMRWIEGTIKNRLYDSGVQALVVNFHDITQPKLVEEQLTQQKQELKRSRDELAVILKNIADGITVQDATGKIIYVNYAAAVSAGYSSAEEMIAAPPLEYLEKFEITDEQGHALPIANMPGRRAIAGEDNPQIMLRFMNKRTREVRWVFIKSTAIYDSDAKPYLVVNAMQDITRLVEFEQRKDDFISMASHELKTPVTSIKGFTQVLRRRLQNRGDGEALWFLSRMDTQLNKLTALIGDLLDIVKIHAGELTIRKEVFNLTGLVREVVQDTQETTQAHRLLLADAEEAQVFGDRERIGQVLINLLTNAVKYSPGADRVIVHVTKDSKHMIVSVQDFGIGIEPAHHHKIFERFYRVDDSLEKTFPGLGIGLYICSEILRRHDGRLWVESKRGKGALFSFSLPIADFSSDYIVVQPTIPSSE